MLIGLAAKWLGKTAKNATVAKSSEPDLARFGTLPLPVVIFVVNWLGEWYDLRQQPLKNTGIFAPTYTGSVPVREGSGRMQP